MDDRVGKLLAAWRLMKPHWVYYMLVVCTVTLGLMKSPWVVPMIVAHGMIWIGFHEKAKEIQRRAALATLEGRDGK